MSGYARVQTMDEPTITVAELTAAELADEPWLLVLVPGKPPRRVRLRQGASIAGRTADCAVHLDDPSVSRRHARLVFRGDVLSVRDLGSHNGTKLSSQIGLRPEIDYPVASGDTLLLGKCALIVRLPRTEEANGLDMVCEDASSKEILRVALRVARSTLPIVIRGESGTGKELLARRIHHESGRAGRFIALALAATPLTLVDSELFGHVRGAFTGAVVDRPGALAEASGGTLFLDDAHSIPHVVQVRLLRVLETGIVRPVGSEQDRAVDLRVIAALDPRQAHLIRDDLRFRLSGSVLELPPLRERPRDLMVLASRFAHEAARQVDGDRPAPTFDADAMQALLEHQWPGNVRQLRNVITSAVVLGDEDDARIKRVDLDVGTGEAAGELHASEDVAAKKSIERALATTGGNRTRAAELLGISRRTLVYRIKRHGIGGSDAGSADE